MSGLPEVTRPLRLGLYLAAIEQPRWVHDVISEITRSGIGTFACVIVDGAGLREADRSWLLRGYLSLDRWWFQHEVADLQLRAPVSGALGNLVPVVIEGSTGVDREAAVQRAVGLGDLDVLFVIGALPPASVLAMPRQGVWAFAHGAGNVLGATEVLRGVPTVPACLMRLSDGAPSVPVASCRLATDDRSAYRTSARALAKSSRMAVAALRSLQRSAGDLEQEDVSEWLAIQTPGNAETVASLGRVGWRVAKSKIDAARFREQWAVGVRWGDGDSPQLEQPPTTFLVPPADRFWADPFPMQVNGQTYVFVEELPFATNKGHISVLQVDETGLLGESEQVLVEDHHLSYPHVFEWDGEIYMTPECQASRRVDLYRAVEFPRRWQRLCSLLEGEIAADPTPFRFDDAWWMFVNLGTPGAPNYDECHLFRGERLEGPWRPHPLNPVCTDVRRARPAGRVFSRNGRLYRPAQDCSVRYGYATVVHEIEDLSRTNYKERVVARIEPQWRPDLLATHTLNHAGRLTVWDALLRRRR